MLIIAAFAARIVVVLLMCDKQCYTRSTSYVEAITSDNIERSGRGKLSSDYSTPHYSTTTPVAPATFMIVEHFARVSWWMVRF